MTNTVYIRPIFVDESFDESETTSLGDDDEDGGQRPKASAMRTENTDGLHEKVALFSAIWMNCFGCYESASKENEEEDDQEEDDDIYLSVTHHTQNEDNQKKEEMEVLLGRTTSARRRRRPNPRLSNPPNNLHGEQVAAGWPSWLSSVASSAINGWTPRQVHSFEKLYKIGQGDRSEVFKARDVLTGKIVALKKIRFVSLNPESVRSLAREILILRRLDHPNVIKLEGLVTSSSSLHLVFEYMENYLADLLKIHRAIKFKEPQVRCYIQQLLAGLDHCHRQGVWHRDINRSHILVNNEGTVKIAGFGSASFFNHIHKLPISNGMVSLWYRAPELLWGDTNYGVGVDLWSTGCILAELFAGKPIMPGHTKEEQLQKIFKLCGSPSEEYLRKLKPWHKTKFMPQQPYKQQIAEAFKDFPPSSLPLIEALLAIDPIARRTARDALRSKFFMKKPDVCGLLTLQQNPPRKEQGKLQSRSYRG